jgi:hypothetical protein
VPVNARSCDDATAPEIDDSARKHLLSGYPPSALVGTLVVARFIFLRRVENTNRDFSVEKGSNALSVKIECDVRYFAGAGVDKGAISLTALVDLNFAYAASTLHPRRPFKLDKNIRSSSSYSAPRAPTADWTF